MKLTVQQMQGYRNNFLGAVRQGNMNGAEVTVDIATAKAVLGMLDQTIIPAAASHADIDLCEPTADTLIKFCTSIIRRAVGDHLGRKRRVSGATLCNEYADGYRGLHVRMASGLYTKTRESLEAHERERERERRENDGA